MTFNSSTISKFTLQNYKFKLLLIRLKITLLVLASQVGIGEFWACTKLVHHVHRTSCSGPMFYLTEINKNVRGVAWRGVAYCDCDG